MSWKIALTVALLTGLITAAVTAPLGDKVTGMLNVSDFEGQRGFFLAFVLIPAGFILGALLGLLGTKLVSASEWSHFWKALVTSVSMGQIAIFTLAGLSLLTRPSVPEVNGAAMALEVEVHIPLDMVTPRAREPNQIRLSLYAGPRDNHYATIDPQLYREEGDKLIAIAVSSLNSKSYSRVISFHIEEDVWLSYDLTTLPAEPGPESFGWSELAPLRDARDSSAPADSRVRLRYRVVAVQGA